MVGVETRLKQIRERLGLKQPEMSRLMGVPYRTYQNYEHGRTAPKISSLHRLSRAAGVSLDWLIDGQEHLDRHADADAVCYLPIYNVSASAGGGANHEEDGPAGCLPLPRAWLERLGAPLNALSAIEASGDSMEPELRDGDTLIVDASARDPARDGLYVLRYDDHLRVKYLQRRADGSILLRSTAEHQADEIVPRDRIRDLVIVGRVRWHGQMV